MKRNKECWYIHVIIVILCLMMMVPFVLMVSISLSSETDIAQYGHSLIPKRIEFSAYKFVLNSNDTLANSYLITIFVTVVGTALSVFMMLLLAYPLSKKYFSGKKFFNFYVYFTMLFNGGLVPTYILNTQYLHLNNNILVYILPSMISVWHVFVLRTFLAQLPEEMFESAKIDGANELTLFFRFAIPLSKPAIATVTLMMALTKWNEWMTAMLYVDDPKLITLQYMLQKIIKNMDLINQFGGTISEMSDAAATIPTESARMAMAVIVAGPMLVIFPFFQKYFTRGLTVGSVKG